MAYTRPTYNADNITWFGKSTYTRPDYTTADVSWYTTPSGENVTDNINPGELVYTGLTLTSTTTGPEYSNIYEGELIFTGENLVIVTPDIKAANMYSVSPQYTVDTYNISNELDTFTAEAQLYWPPGASIVDEGVFSITHTIDYLVDSTTYTISPGHIAVNYFQDYYYRIHIIPKSINYGNILTEKTVDLEIWNAFFNTVDFTSVEQIGVDGISVDLGFTLPKTYQKLEYTTSSVTATVEGSPSMDGYLSFIFDIIDIPVLISGKRALFFPFVPNINFTEVREWLTDVISHRKGEQKTIIRDIPRMNLSYTYEFRSEEEYGNARQFADTLLEYALATALWTETVFIGEVTSTNTIIPFDTTFLEYDTTDSIIVLWESYTNFSLHEVLSVSSSYITLKLPTGKNYTKAWIAPVKIGRAVNGIQLTRSDNRTPKANIDISYIFNPYTDADWTADITYKSYPVLDTKLVVSGGLTDKGTRKLDIFDSEVYTADMFTVEDYNRLEQTVRLTALTRQERYELRRLIDWFQGKYQSFWLPSFNNDAVALTNVAIGDNAVTISYANWVLIKPKYIRLIGNYTHYAEITEVVNNLDGTESITFTPAVSASLVSIRRIEVVKLMRLNTDRIEFAQETAIRTTVSLPVISENY